MTIESHDPWDEFRLDTEDGHGLIRPRFQMTFRVEYPRPETVLRFHDAAQQLIGDRLGWYSTGSGKWTRRTARTGSIVPTWCRDPKPWQPHVYTFIAQDVNMGIGDVELKIHYAARPLRPPPPELLPRLLQGMALPRYHTELSLALPVDHDIVTSGAVVDWIRNAAPVVDPSFIGAVAGWAIDVPHNPPAPALGPVARARAGALLQKHPGLTCYSHMALGLACLQWDLEYARAKGAATPRPYIPRADWITVLNADQVGLLGGDAELRASLADGGPSIEVESAGSGILIRAGAAPQVGDLSVGYVPADYIAVSKAVARVALPLGAFKPQLSQSFSDEGLRIWFDALSQAVNSSPLR
jgi:hypothetical protein